MRRVPQARRCGAFRNGRGSVILTAVVRLGWRCGLAMLFAAGLSLVASTSCGDDTFACIADGDCEGAGASAGCEASGYCSISDLACPGGRRYAELAPSSLAGECVDDGNASAATMTTSSTEPTGDAGSSDETAMPPGFDAYGPCASSEDCVVSGSVCVTNGDNRMCAPPCTDAVSPSAECPPEVDGGTDVGCLYTDGTMTAVRCFALCNLDMLCPAGMSCVDPVCTWSGP